MQDRLGDTGSSEILGTKDLRQDHTALRHRIHEKSSKSHLENANTSFALSQLGSTEQQTTGSNLSQPCLEIEESANS